MNNSDSIDIRTAYGIYRRNRNAFAEKFRSANALQRLAIMREFEQARDNYAAAATAHTRWAPM